MPRTAAALLIVVAALLATLAGAAAQDASPVAEPSPVDGCDVIPRDEDDLVALNATATSLEATPVTANPIELPDGGPVDSATLNALDDTLRLVAVCAETGELAKLFALYSDAYIAGIALAPEPVPIVPGQGGDHPGGPVGTPGAAAGLIPRVETAVILPDGRIAARVSAEGLAGSADIVFFIEVDSRWVIDEIREALPQGALGGDLPFPVQAAVASAAAEQNISPDDITVVDYEAVEWPDTSLGCPKEGEFYAQVITPGYRVTLSIAGQEVEYHTDAVDRADHCDAG
jgi:hypothetical protein